MTSGFIHLPQRTIVSLQGPDTMALLERLVTNATTEWASGETRYGALLTPQGKIIADYLSLRTDDGVILDVSKDHAADLAKRLKMFRLRSDVDIEVLDHLHVMASLEPDPDPFEGAAYIYQDPRYPDGRTRVLVEGTVPDADASALTSYHADRITNVVPEQGSDFGAAEVFPAEINMDALNGVALNKGCFVGQEVVSRMHRRGKIRKRTLSVTVPETLTVQPGDDIKAPLPIGTISSVSGNRALALVRVDRLLAAEKSGAAPTLHETPVTFEKPGWLEAELARMEET
jgi:folate-binding protein YgfZ